MRKEGADQERDKTGGGGVEDGLGRKGREDEK
jgi:hypothetical protein